MRRIALVCLQGTLATSAWAADKDLWPAVAPEQLPPLTVRWDNGAQRDRFAVEGERYSCKVGLHPARIISLECDGRPVLGPAGLALGFSTADGEEYVVAPPNLVPTWDTWQGQSWQPARSSAARMNVWRSSPYYWDAHLLDIPFIRRRDLPAEPAAAAGPADVLQEWTFADDTAGWEALNQCSDFTVSDGSLHVTYNGEDPYFQSPQMAIPGPVTVRLRLRRREGPGTLALYWVNQGQGGYGGDRVIMARIEGGDDWGEVDIPIPGEGSLQRVRLDPPGSSGVLELARVQVLRREARPPVVPLRGEIVFHAFADRLNLEFRIDPAEGVSPPALALWQVAAPAATEALRLGERPVAFYGSPGQRLALLGAPGSTLGPETWTASLEGQRPGTWWVIRPETPGQDAAQRFAEEIDPLDPRDVTVKSAHWRGYDPFSGLYEVDSISQGSAFSFNTAYDSPVRRQAIPLRIAPQNRPRDLMVRCASGAGILPATVLTDEHGFMLPTAVLSCKNFAGEKEEPDDTAFGEAYFPLHLTAAESTALQVVHLFQQWGTTMLQQVSSIRFFHIYWHLSQGVSETTCFTIPWMELNGVYVRIPDYRPYSGPFWPGQPQHDCRTWPGLLQYRSGGRRVPLVTERTTFESTTPCLARFTMTFRTADDAATVSMTTTEFPQNDEMRTFLHLRYDWDKAVTIDGDARSTFRWLNLNDKRLPAKLVWLDAEGVPQVVDVAEDSDPLPLTALAAEAPYVGSHDLGGYHSFCLVRSYSARLGGQEQTQLYVSAHFGKRTGDTWFTVDQEDLTLQPGDYLEADLMLMPHADPTEPGAIPQRERQRYGTHPPRITEVKRGEKLADFPPRVRAEADAAVFTVEGGQKTMPLIVEGLSASKVPMLWEGSTWMDQQVKGGDGYQVNVGPDGSYRAIFAAPMRDEQTRTWSVTLATCSSDISRLSDDNGFPVLEAVEPGRFALSTPVLFAPGTNTLREGSSLGSFEGEGIRVRAVPISARLQGATGEVTITRWDESAADVAVDGLAALTFHDIGRRTTWAVTVDGTTETRRADTGAMELPLSEGSHTIALRRAPEMEGKR